MKNVKKILLLLISIFAYTNMVEATSINTEEIPNESYVIGSYLLTRDDNEIYNTENMADNPNKIYDEYEGLNDQTIMLSASSIKNPTYSNMIIYYKNYRGAWRNGTTGESEEVGETFNITHVNGICIDSSCMGDEFHVTFEAQEYEANIFQTKTIQLAYGDKITSTQLPTLNNRPGFKFVCWTKKGEDECFDFNISITDDGTRIPTGERNLTLEIKWEQIEYIITYNSNFEGGSTKVVEECHYYDETNPNNCKFALYDSLNIGENPSYNFMGWSLTPDGKTLYQPETEMSVILGNEQNITLYAIWSANDYRVRYDLDGGTFNPNDEIVNGFNSETTSIILYNPTKVGYNFISWQLDGKDFDGTNLPKNDITLKAKFEPITYKFTYGNQIKECTYDLRCDLDFETTEIAGQTFLGLFLEDNSKLPDYVTNFTAEDGQNFQVHHEYSTIKYAIDYDYRGGEVATSNPKEFEYNASAENTITITNLPTREGYTFSGFNVEGRAQVSEDNRTITITAAENIKLIANWTPIQFTFTYNGEVTTCTYDQQCNLEFEEPVVAGKEFKYWYYMENQEKVRIDKYVTNYTNLPKEYNIYAEIGEITYNITYDYAGGTVSTPNIGEYKVSTTTLPLIIPTKTGYTFTGWTVSENATISEDNQTLTIQNVGNVTLTANWSVNSFTFKYKEDKYVTCTYGTECKIDFEADLVAGQEFKYWFYKDESNNEIKLDLNVTNYTSENKEYNIEPKYGNITYTIAYEYNGGKVTEANKTTYEVGEEIQINLPTKPGYKIKEWKTSENAEVTNDNKISIKEVGNVTLEVIWEPIQYIFTYEDQEPITCTYGEECRITFEPVKVEGLVFKNWYYLNDANEEVLIDVNVTNYTTIDNKTYELKAKNGSIGYNIAYEYNGGKVTEANKTEFTVETEPFTLNRPTKEGYIFKNWRISEGPATIDGDIVTITGAGNVKVEAEWTPITYKFTYAYKNQERICTYDEQCVLDFETEAKEGKNFAYLYVEVEGERIRVPEFVNNFTTKDNTTYEIKAEYSAITYAIYYNLDGGNAVNPYRFTFDYENAENNKITLTEPTKTGYTFVEWVVVEEGTAEVNSKTQITATSAKDIKLKAIWSANKYTLKYTEDKKVECTYDEECHIPFQPDNIAGKTFKYWTIGEGEETRQIPEYVKNVTTENAEIALKANYDEIKYTISYEYNGGRVVTPNAKEYTVSQNTFTLEVPTRLGYTFASWEMEGSAQVSEDNQTITLTGTEDVKLTAKWNPITYILKYTEDKQLSCTYDTKCEINFMADEKVGQEFTNWYTMDASDNRLIVPSYVNNFTNKAETIIIFPAYSLIKYNVTYDYDGGNVPNNNPELITYNVDAENNTYNLTTPTRKGFTFAGWEVTAENNNATAADNLLTITGAGDITLKAKWTERNITLNYNVDGNITTKTCLYSECRVDNEEPTKAAYDFNGWADETGIIYKNGSSLNIGENDTINLTAKWTNTYRYFIDYELNGGSVEGSGDLPRVYLNGEDVVLPSLTKEGYIFNGWKQEESMLPSTSGVTVITKPTSDLKLTADFTPITYTFKYEEETKTCTYDEECILDFVQKDKAGYTSLGLYLDEERLPEKVTNYTVENNKEFIITPRYTLISYNVTYNYNGGTGTNQSTYTVETNTFTLTPPTKTGYTFSSWTIPEGRGTISGNDVTITGTEDVEITANYTPIKFTFLFNEQEIVCTYDTPCDLSTLNTDVAGKILTGLYTTKDGASVKLESDVTNFTNVEETFNVTAEYAAIPYNITYDYAGGTVDIENRATYTVDDNTFLLNVPTKVGYTLNGWTISDNKGTIENNNVTISGLGEVTITALWEAKQYNINFYNGEALLGTQTCTYDELCTLDTFDLGPSSILLGWSLTTDDTGFKYGDKLEGQNFAEGADEINFYAVTQNAYLIDAAGVGTSVFPNRYIPSGEKLGELPSGPTIGNLGVEIIGWKIKDTETEVTSETIVTGPMTLVPIFKNIEYNISYDLDEGTAPATEAYPTTFNAESNSYELINPTKEGYIFAGWEVIEGGDVQFVALDESSSYRITMEFGFGKKDVTDVKLKANWIENTVVPENYTIEYDVAEGEIDIASLPTTVSTGEKIILPSTGTKEGFIFQGWKIDGNEEIISGGSEVTIEANTKFIAVWVIEDTTVEPENPTEP